MTIKLLSRQQIDPVLWNACVAASPQRIVYGYSWYLDVVLPAPNWKWMGLVISNKQGSYRAVMPVPLRRKQLAGVTFGWVVHQPFFCQFLSVFSAEHIDPTPFLLRIQQQFRYGSRLHQIGNITLEGITKSLSTHILDLSIGYQALFQNYSNDRKINLRRAETANWIIMDSAAFEPLLRLFRQNHADSIDGGVPDWSYALFDKLGNELLQRGLGILRYAILDGNVEAGAFFVIDGGRIIYLFNAASDVGRQKNARTLLIDQVIREHSGKNVTFDFESPSKPSVVRFYQSFGAVEEPFWCVRWNRLTLPERLVLRLFQSVSR